VVLVSGPRSPDLTLHLGPGMHVVSTDAWARSKHWKVVVVDLG
jgi:hypothetical protein